MEELSKSFTGAESVVEVEQSGPIVGNTHCLNCGAQLTGKYCPNCGQKDLPKRQGTGDLIINFISSFWSFESKFFKTFGTLLFKPGRIINDYNQGKRETYYHPARMYVFLSFVFFLVLALAPEEDVVKLKEDDRELTPEEKQIVLDTVSAIPWQAKTIEEYDSIEAAKTPSDRDGWIKRFFTRRFIELRQRKGVDGIGLWETFGNSLQENIPRMTFLLLPIVALLLKLLYVRRDFYYSEHLIFAVFFYDFMFLAGTLNLLVSQVSWLEWLSLIIALYMMYYLYKAMRRVYGQSRFKTVIKYFLLLWMFSICLLVAFLINVLVTLLLL